MLLTSANCLGLSIVILLTPRDDLFSGPRMESRPASYPHSICQPVASHNCISQVIYWPHARDSCGTEQVNGYMKGSPEELCTGEPQNTTVCKVRSCGTVQIGKMYSILQVGLKYCLQVELGLSVEQERGWLAI